MPAHYDEPGGPHLRQAGQGSDPRVQAAKCARPAVPPDARARPRATALLQLLQEVRPRLSVNYNIFSKKLCVIYYYSEVF